MSKTKGFKSYRNAKLKALFPVLHAAPGTWVEVVEAVSQSRAWAFRDRLATCWGPRYAFKVSGCKVMATYDLKTAIDSFDAQVKARQQTQDQEDRAEDQAPRPHVPVAVAPRPRAAVALEEHRAAKAQAAAPLTCAEVEMVLKLVRELVPVPLVRRLAGIESSAAWYGQETGAGPRATNVLEWLGLGEKDS